VLFAKGGKEVNGGEEVRVLLHSTWVSRAAPRARLTFGEVRYCELDLKVRSERSLPSAYCGLLHCKTYIKRRQFIA